MAFRQRITQSESYGGRMDGYNEPLARVVCQFQVQVELSGVCDYKALKDVLEWSRSQSHLTIEALYVKYNNTL